MSFVHTTASLFGLGVSIFRCYEREKTRLLNCLAH